MIDTHSHIYLEQFDEDRDNVIKRALEVGVEKILLPNIDCESISSMLKTARSYPKICFPMMGLHPTSVDGEFNNQLKEMYDWFKKFSFCAVGEIGIDLYWDKTYLKQQKDCFAIQLGWAKEFDLPVVIHARDAFDEIFEVMDSVDLSNVSGVFHSFSGDLDQAMKALSYNNFKLGINGVITFKNSGMDKIVSQLNIEDFVLETDAPYLTPVPYRGKRNEPAYLSMVIEKLADIFNVEKQEIIDITNYNAQKLFNLENK